jgi:hypothetical protein
VQRHSPLICAASQREAQDQPPERIDEANAFAAAVKTLICDLPLSI